MIKRKNVIQRIESALKKSEIKRVHPLDIAEVYYTDYMFYDYLRYSMLVPRWVDIQLHGEVGIDGRTGERIISDASIKLMYEK